MIKIEFNPEKHLKALLAPYSKLYPKNSVLVMCYLDFLKAFMIPHYQSVSSLDEVLNLDAKIKVDIERNFKALKDAEKYGEYKSKIYETFYSSCKVLK